MTTRFVLPFSWSAVAGALALACYVAPGAMAIGLGAVMALLVLGGFTWAFAELAVLIFLALTAGLMRASDLYVPLPLGGLYPADVVLIGLLCFLLTRSILWDRSAACHMAMFKPLVVFLGVCALSLVYAVQFAEVPLNSALNELRPIAFYAVAVVTALAVTRKRQLDVLLIGLLILTNVIVAAIVLQQFAGVGRFLLPGMDEWQVGQVDSAGTTDVDTSSTFGGIGGVRLVPPAHVLLFFVTVLAFIMMVAPRASRSMRVFWAAEFAVVNCGLLLTYTRGQWVASVISLGLAFLLLPRVAQVRIAGVLVAGGGIATLCVLLFAAGLEPPGNVAAYGGALAARALSALNVEDTLGSPSLQWRVFETEQAVNALTHAPQGVGLGNAYRPVTTFQGEAAGYQGTEPLNRFVHNSFLYIAVKTGLLGLAAFMWFCLAFLVSSMRIFRRTPDGPERWLVLAVLVTFIGVLSWSLTEANFMQTGSTALIGLLVGIVASVNRLFARPHLASRAA